MSSESSSEESLQELGWVRVTIKILLRNTQTRRVRAIDSKE
jgi:hypothetical protein